MPAALTLWPGPLTDLNNRRQSIWPRPDSRTRLEWARYKYLTNCSRLLSPTSPFSHAHSCTHHHPDSSPPGLAQWACYKKASAYGSRVGWTPARRNNITVHRAHWWIQNTARSVAANTRTKPTAFGCESICSRCQLQSTPTITIYYDYSAQKVYTHFTMHGERLSWPVQPMLYITVVVIINTLYG